MALMGSHDQNLREPLDCEEWQSAVGLMGVPDWGDDQQSTPAGLRRMHETL